MTRILLADTHPVNRSGWLNLIKLQPELRVAAVASDSRQVLEHAVKKIADLILLDWDLPGTSGPDLLQELQRSALPIRVLAYSGKRENEEGLQAMRSGAAGFISTSASEEELMAAINKIIRGGKYASPGLQEQLLFEFDSDHGPAPHNDLSRQELLVLKSLGRGELHKTIAANLAIKEKTVSGYRARIMQKLRVKTNAGLIRYCAAHGL